MRFTFKEVIAILGYLVYALAFLIYRFEQRNAERRIKDQEERMKIQNRYVIATPMNEGPQTNFNAAQLDMLVRTRYGNRTLNG